MKNRIISYTLGLMAIALLASCSKWLDVQPRTKIKSDVLLQTEQGYRDALIGCYTLLKNQSLYGRELTFGFADAVSLQYDTYNNNVYNNVARWIYTNESVRAQIDNIWGRMYNVLANVNNILDHIDADKALFTGTNYEIIKGEALAIRAFVQFDLLRFFAPSDLSKPAVPYVNTLTTKVTAPSSGTEVIGYLLRDIEEATALLAVDPIIKGKKLVFSEDEFMNNRHQRLNYYAVKGLAARVHMWNGDKPKALESASVVLEAGDRIFPWIKTSNISATNDKDKDFTFSTENLFALNVWDLRTVSNNWFIAAFPGNQLFRGSFYFDQMYEKTSVGASDYRLLFLTRMSGSNYILYKYYQPDNYTASYANMMPLMRRSEMNYIAAECLVGVDNARAVALLNEVRSNRGITVPLSSSLTDASITSEILKEYRKEFQGEGQIFHYCKRTKMQSFPTNSTKLTDAHYVLPKPNNEIEFGGY